VKNMVMNPSQHSYGRVPRHVYGRAPYRQEHLEDNTKLGAHVIIGGVFWRLGTKIRGKSMHKPASVACTTEPCHTHESGHMNGS